MYKDQTSFFFFFTFTPSSLPSNNMSAPAKSTTPIAPAVVKSKDWMKATTPELLSSSEDESSILDARRRNVVAASR